MKKKILVTGGAGFIGSHLIEELLKDGNSEVYSLDNYFTGSKDNHIEGAIYIEGHTKDIEKLIDFKPDLIYHLGEYSRVLQSFDDMDKVWDLNIFGTFKVLEFCKKNNVRLIYAGSSTKFGEFYDEENPASKSPYAWSKYNNTELVNNYGSWFNLDYAIAYFYNVSGGGERSGQYGTLIGIFTDKFKKGERLTIYGDGKQKRAFTMIEDTVAGLILVGNKGSGDGYCLGTEKTYSVLEIAKMFGGRIDFLPAKRGDRDFSKIDLSKARALGFKAEGDVRDYIEKVKNG